MTYLFLRFLLPISVGIALYFTPINCKAQKVNLDSLNAIWHNQHETDSLRVVAFTSYIQHGFLYSKPDSAAKLADQLIAFSEKQTYLKAKAVGMNLKGAANLLQGENEQALKYFELTLKVYEQLKNEKGIANLLNNIGIIHFNSGNYLIALGYYKRSLLIYEQQNNKVIVARSLNNIGLIYQNLEDYTMAQEYFSRSMKISKELNDNKGIANALSNIGSNFFKQEKLEDALAYFEESLRINEEMDDKNGISISLNNLGSIYSDLGKKEIALGYYEKSLKIKESLGDKKGTTRTLINVGNISKERGEYDKTIEYCQKALNMSRSLENLQLQKDACMCLSETYGLAGQWEKAFEYLRNYNQVETELKAKATEKELQQFEFDRRSLRDSISREKEKRMIDVAHQQEINKKNKIQYAFIAGGAFVLLLAIGLYSRLRFTNRTKKVIEAEKERSEKLLLNILPATVADELKSGGQTKAKQFDKVSVLFTDFKSFTQTAEKLSATELVEELNVCFKAFDAICKKYLLEKIKTIGDAYMVASGLNSSNPTQQNSTFKNTKNMVLAAIEMQNFMIIRNKNLQANPKSSGMEGFKMRAGIHTGSVVAGVVGDIKFQYDIWGDAVNTASRMESAGEVGKVNISQATYKLLMDTEQSRTDQFSFENRGKIKAKGKGEMEMYFVSLKKGV